MELQFRNKITIDVRILSECQKKIDKTRFYKLIKMLCQSVCNDSLHPEGIEEHDSYFEPRTVAEKDLWQSCRELAKKDMETLLKSVQGGKKSAEIRKNKKTETETEDKEETKTKNKTSSLLQIDFNHRESFMRADPKSLVDALKSDIVPNLCVYLYTGKEPTDEQLNNYVQMRASTGWEKKGGTPIRSIGADLASWLKREKPEENPQRNEFGQQVFKMSDKPITYEEMIAQTKE